MKVAIIGSIAFERHDVFMYFLKKYHSELIEFESDLEIVSGGGDGTDALAKSLTNTLRVKYTEFVTDYSEVNPVFHNQSIVEYADYGIIFLMEESKGLLGAIKNFHDLGKTTYVYKVDDSSIVKELLDDLGYELIDVAERNLKFSADHDSGDIPQPLYHLQGNKDKESKGGRIEGGLFHYKEDAERIKQMLPNDIFWEITDIPIFYEPKEN